LRWRTLTESNNFGFNVERSTDRSTWNAIGFAAGHGTSSVANNYSYIDATPETERSTTLFYRLKQLDRDGREQFSPVVEVLAPSQAGFRLTGLYPQPARSSVLVSILLSEARTLRIAIVNTLGSEVLLPLADVRMEAGSVSIPINTAGLLPGTYICRVTTETGSASKLLVIAR
jgi:hypothetical protein